MQLQVLIASVLQSVTHRQRVELDMNVQLQVFTQPCSRTDRRTRYERAATSTYCLSPAVSNERLGVELDRNVHLQVLIETVLQSLLKEKVELDRNVQLQVLIASVLQSVLTDGDKN